MNIHVAAISHSVEEEELKALFEQYGTVSFVQIICDRDTGVSRGFGEVRMESDEDAQTAIEALNGYEFKGRALIVVPARERNRISNHRLDRYDRFK